jgi:hypothetical protein
MIPKKPAPDLIRGGNRFSKKIMLKQEAGPWSDSTELDHGLAPDQSDDHQQDDGADHGVDDRGNDSGADRNSKLRQQPAGDERADDADDDISNQPEAVTLDDEAREPARDGADDQPNDNAFNARVSLPLRMPSRAAPPTDIAPPSDYRRKRGSVRSYRSLRHRCPTRTASISAGLVACCVSLRILDAARRLTQPHDRGVELAAVHEDRRGQV